MGMRVQPSKGAIGKVEGENTPLDVQLLDCLLGGQSCYHYILPCVSKKTK